MEYHCLEGKLRKIYANYVYEGPRSILYASNLEHIDLHTFKSIVSVAIAMVSSQNDDYQEICKLSNDAIEAISKTSDRDKVRQIFLNFKDSVSNSNFADE